MKTRKRWRSDFKSKDRRPPASEAAGYDIHFDAVLIEQSIAKQYGVLPTLQGELAYTDWAKLVGGLMEDTPLGRVVETRMEKDPKAIARMTPWQHAERSRWRQFLTKQANQTVDPDRARAQMGRLEAQLAKLFG